MGGLPGHREEDPSAAPASPFASPVDRVTWRRALLAVALAGLALALAHGDGIARNFGVVHWEDDAFFEHDRRAIHSLADCFTKRPLWPGLYRPLTTSCYYHLGGLLFAHRIQIYHALNVALLLGNALLLFAVCVHWFPWRLALLPPVVVASRLAMVEVAQNTCEVQALLSVFFCLLAFKLFLVGRARGGVRMEGFALAAFALALLSKESAIVLPGLLLLHAYLLGDRTARWRTVPFFVVSGVWVALAVTVFRDIVGTDTRNFVPETSIVQVARSTAAHVLDFFNVLTYRQDDYRMVERVLALSASPSVQIVLALTFVGTGALLLLHRRLLRSLPAPRAHAIRVVLLGLFWFALAVAPFAILRDRLFMRYSYFAHHGLAIAASACLALLATGCRRSACRRGPRGPLGVRSPDRGIPRDRGRRCG